MADSKTSYSNESNNYVTNSIHSSKIDMDRYNRSKVRENKYNENWKKNSVNINDIVNLFTPNAVGSIHGVKYQFEGNRYRIVADMASGYLRIFDKILGQYVRLDGSIGTTEETHFKIKKRSEM
jgi:hypothetical protein